MLGHVRKMRYLVIPSSLFLHHFSYLSFSFICSLAKTLLFPLFCVCLSSSLSLSHSLCVILLYESHSLHREPLIRDASRQVRRAVFESPRCSPFRRLHYAMRILEESEGYFLQGVPGVWGRPELETFLACRVMVCLKLNYRKCRAILDDWLNTHRKGKHGARESIDIALY